MSSLALRLVEKPASFLEGVGLVAPVEPAGGGASRYAPLALDRFVTAMQRPLEALEVNPGAARDIKIVNPAVQALEDERKAKAQAQARGPAGGGSAPAEAPPRAAGRAPRNPDRDDDAKAAKKAKKDRKREREGGEKPKKAKDKKAKKGKKEKHIKKEKKA